MSDVSSIIIALIILVSFLFGFQNTSFVPSELRSSGSLSLNMSKIIAIAGLTSAAIIEGNSMTKSLTVQLARGVSINDGMVTLLITAAFIIGLKLAKLSVPFSTIIVGSFLGSAVASSIPVNVPRAELIIAFWLLSPLFTGIVSYAIYRIVMKITQGISLITISSLQKAGSILTSFVVAYSLAVNNIGLILGLGENLVNPSFVTLFPIILALIAGVGIMLLTDRSAARSMTNRLFFLSPKQIIVAFISGALIVWIATRLQIPVWITPCIFGGLVGVVVGKEIHKINRALAIEALLAWIIIPVSAFFFSFVLSNFI